MDLQSFLCGLDAERLRNWPRNVLPRPPRLGLHPARAVSTVRQRVNQLADTPRQVLNHVNRERTRRHLPIPTGPYTVGCVDIMSGHTVNGTFIRLYYPTTPTATDIYLREAQWPLWLPRKQYGHGYVYFRRRNPIFGKILNWVGGDVYVPVLWQAPVIESDDQFPVLVFSHGLGGNRTTNTTICYDLASHGYIVAAIEHRDGSASMTYCFKEPVNNNNAGEEDSLTSGSDEEEEDDLLDCQFDILHENHSFQQHWLQYQRQEDELNYELRNKQVHMRAKEMSKVLDILETINAGKEVRNVLGLHFDMRQFKNKMDFSRVAVAGHSFGGGTSVATLAHDKRFKCGIGLDSWMIPLDDGVYNATTQPVLLLNMETFQWPANVRAMSKLHVNQPGDLNRIMITIMGTCHQTVSDFQFVMPSKLARLAELRHTLEPHIAMDLVKRTMRGFLSKHLDIPATDHHEDILLGKHGLVIRGTNLDLRQNWGPRP